jgi:hypothetical protein
MSITILSRISMCADDLALLDKMAASAGKSRDVFVSDILFHVLAIEHQVGLGEYRGTNGKDTPHRLLS